jgi:hypothetical protein
LAATLPAAEQEAEEACSIGLILCSHRRKGDCDDVRLAFDLGPNNKLALTTVIVEINPKRKTPNAGSFKTAAIPNSRLWSFP